MYSEKELKRFFNKLVKIETYDKQNIQCYFLGKDMEQKWKYLCMSIEGDLFKITRSSIKLISKDVKGEK